MKKKLIVLGISILVIINLSSLATICYYRWFQNKEADQQATSSNGMCLCQKLSLSEPQINNVKTIRECFWLQCDTLLLGLQKYRAELIEHLMSAEPDSERIFAVLKKINSNQAYIQKNVINNLLQQKELLNPEQQKRFFVIIMERLLKGSIHHKTIDSNLIKNCDDKGYCPHLKRIKTD